MSASVPDDAARESAGRVPWFHDLLVGRGAAAPLDDDLRAVLRAAKPRGDEPRCSALRRC